MSTPRTPKRACDQCHLLKEKCCRTSAETSCQRCDRLGQVCQTTRNAAKTGRKRRTSRELSYTLPTSAKSKITTINTTIPSEDHLDTSFVSYSARLASNSVIFSDLDGSERYFLNLMNEITTPSPLSKYLIGSTFYKTHHSLFVQNLTQPSPILRNATVACAAALLGDLSNDLAEKGLEIGHRRAALAVSSLRSLEIDNEQDLTTAIVLGVALLTFAMHVVDGQPLLISHYTLNLIKLQCPDFSGLDPSLMDLLMCLVCTETFECILRSQVPTLKVNAHDRGCVDRYLGISSPMISYFYDICLVSNLLQEVALEDDPDLLGRLKEIQLAVEEWRPISPPDFVERFTHIEITVMIAQAKILRLAALLIIHRLRHPFGEQDRDALLLSNAITAELENSIPCTSLAYLAACFEVADKEARERVLERSTQIVTFSKQAQIRFKATLSSMWKARDSGNLFYWFELHKYLPGSEIK